MNWWQILQLWKDDDEDGGGAAEAEDQQTAPEDQVEPAVDDEPPGEDPEQTALQRELIRGLGEKPKADADDEPEADEETPEDRPTPEAEPAGDVEPEPGEDEDQRYTYELKHRGRVIKKLEGLSLQEFEELKALESTAEQFPVIQKKYTAMLERETGQPPGEEAAPGQPARPTFKDIMAMSDDDRAKLWDPLVKEDTDQGFYGDGTLAEELPHVARELSFARRAFLPLCQLVIDMANEVQGLSHEAQKREAEIFSTRFDQIIDEIADSGGGFAPLSLASDAGREERMRLFEHLRSVINPADEGADEKWFDRNFIAGQWRAMNEAMFSKLDEERARLAKEAKDDRVRRAKGARTPAGRGRPPAEPKTGDEQVDLQRALVERLGGA